MFVPADAEAQQADMEEISNQILDLYERGSAASIRPALRKEEVDRGGGVAERPGRAGDVGVVEQARRDRAADGREARTHRPY